MLTAIKRQGLPRASQQIGPLHPALLARPMMAADILTAEDPVSALVSEVTTELGRIYDSHKKKTSDLDARLITSSNRLPTVIFMAAA